MAVLLNFGFCEAQMKRKLVFNLSLILLLSLGLSACIGLLPLEEKPATGDYGPQYSPKEHQTRTFNSLWTYYKESYIYFDSAQVDWETLRGSYQKRIDSGMTDEEFASLLKGLETDLPKGSLIYQTRAERIDSNITNNSTYEGIGAFVGFKEKPQPHIILLSIIKGSPAETAGLKAHDSILAIDGKPILLEEGLSAVDRVRGPSGSTVTLTIQSPGKTERAVQVQRGRLVTSNQLETRQISGKKYGYVLFPPAAYTELESDVKAALQSFTTNQQLKGLILDLRIAGPSGGWPLDGLFTLFQDGAIGEFYNRTNSQLDQVKGLDAFGSQTVPLVILVGQNTQGLPEIFAASLQMYKRATIIGATTPGSIETTSAFYLPDGSRIFVESTSFKLPNGTNVGNEGVKPNIEEEAGWDDVLPDNDPVIDSAVKVLESQQ